MNRIELNWKMRKAGTLLMEDKNQFSNGWRSSVRFVWLTERNEWKEWSDTLKVWTNEYNERSSQSLNEWIAEMVKGRWFSYKYHYKLYSVERFGIIISTFK